MPMRPPVNRPFSPALAPALALFALLLPAHTSAQVKEKKRLEACREVMEELLGGEERIPRDMLDKAECVAVVPSAKKLALGFGGGNENVYGERVDAGRRLLEGAYPVPAAARGLVDLLATSSPRQTP